MKSIITANRRTSLWFLLAFNLLRPIPGLLAADLYSYESFNVGSPVGGYDNWRDAPNAGRAIIAMDSLVNGTLVARHEKETVFDEPAILTRTNDIAFNFLPFTGSETNAIIQFEATGEHVAMFALGTDLNSDGVLTAAQGELGPSFGVFDRQFRIQEANQGTSYDDGFNEGGGDANSGNDWYRIQLRMNLPANDGDGTGTLYFKNLTDGNVNWHTVSGLRTRPLGLKRLHPASGPTRWSAMWLHLFSNGNNIPSVDNLVPNASTIRITGIEWVDGAFQVSWRGGLGPFQLQQRTDLNSDSWQDVDVPTLLSVGSISMTSVTAFIRVTQF